MSERFTVAFTPRAARAVEDGKRWWRGNRTKAPAALKEELATALDLIAATPSTSIGTVARNVRLPGVRRVVRNRVNYFLYYRPNFETQTIEIVALWHARRGTPPRL